VCSDERGEDRRLLLGRQRAQGAGDGPRHFAAQRLRTALILNWPLILNLVAVLLAPLQPSLREHPHVERHYVSAGNWLGGVIRFLPGKVRQEH
jgi:hypothetical protein